MIPDFELYIHIPFCVRKCAYCDFLSAPASEDVRERYVQALCREIRESGESLRDRKKAEQALCREIKASGQRKTSLAERTVSTVFFGGGTPSILIRGINSITSSTEPLILVDGVEVHDISYLNPRDVRSVDVLKDGSAAIYGSRGGNGVILLTLKR